MTSIATHEEREKKFLSLFNHVKADGPGGTGMGTSDKEFLDQALKAVDMKNVPDHVVDPVASLPQAKKVVQHASLADQVVKNQVEAPPLKYDDKTQKFYKLFDHVPEGTKMHYGGQAYTPEHSNVEMSEVSDQPYQEPPQVYKKVVKPPSVQEYNESSQQSMPAKPDLDRYSQKYQEAHKHFEQIYREPQDE